jgi:hypothetical protein
MGKLSLTSREIIFDYHKGPCKREARRSKLEKGNVTTEVEIEVMW